MKYFYTNIMDSVIYANFKGHQYGITYLGDGKTFEEYQNKMETFLEDLDNNIKDDKCLVLTLNQFCDNHYLLLQNNHFEMIKRLMKAGKLKISRYGGHTITSYTKKNLRECLIRLCGGDSPDERVYISSLFPSLGADNSAKPTLRGIEFLIGWRKKLYYDDKKMTFSYDKPDNYTENSIFYSFNYDSITCASNDKIKSFMEFKKEAGVNGLYILFLQMEWTKEWNKALELEPRPEWMKKIVFVPGEPQPLDFVQYAYASNGRSYSNKAIFLWMKQIFEIEKLADKYNVYLDNVYSGNDFKLSAVVKYMLEEKDILKSHLSYWIGRIRNRDAFDDSIKKVLEILSKNPEATRTSMYIQAKSAMEQVASKETEKGKWEKDANGEYRYKKGSMIYENFHVPLIEDTSKSEISKKEKKRIQNKVPYLLTLYVIYMAIDFCYNVLNSLYAIEDPTIREYDFKIEKLSDSIESCGFQTSDRQYHINIERLKQIQKELQK